MTQNNNNQTRLKIIEANINTLKTATYNSRKWNETTARRFAESIQKFAFDAFCELSAEKQKNLTHYPMRTVFIKLMVTGIGTRSDIHPINPHRRTG